MKLSESEISTYRSIKLKISATPYDTRRLSRCNKESAEIWNKLLILNKNRFESEQKLYTNSELKALTKEMNTKVICASNKQCVANNLFLAYKAISAARKQGRDDLKYPHKYKRFYNTEWNYQFIKVDYINNKIFLTTTRYKNNFGKPKNGKQIILSFKTSLPQNIKSLKLSYENGSYYAILNTLFKVENKVLKFNNKASIDLGEIHAITSVDNNQNQLIITGRKIRSIKQFRNKKLAELRSKMDKCEAGSRQRNKYRLAYAKIRSKCRRQLDYHIHKLTRMYTNWAIEKGISVVYCGDVTGIEYGTNKTGSNVTRQKINQWEYGKIVNLLEYKLCLEGIQFLKVDESYSSQICPCCGFKTKVKNRNYKCNNCEEEFHRDIVGAWNILNRNYKLDFQPNSNIKYLRIS